jgi:hypothetical protein
MRHRTGTEIANKIAEIVLDSLALFVIFGAFSAALWILYRILDALIVFIEYLMMVGAVSFCIIFIFFAICAIARWFMSGGDAAPPSRAS